MEDDMTMSEKRKVFIEMAEQFNACAMAQKNWDSETFEKCFNCTKDQALENNIKVFREKLFDIA
jgi:hypothetical protein